MHFAPLVTCLVLLLSGGHSHAGLWDRMAFDSTYRTKSEDAVQLVKSSLAELESDLRGILMALTQARGPYLQTKDALAKFNDFMGDLQNQNANDPILSLQKIVENLMYPMEGYENAIYKLKYAVYETLKTLGYFKSTDDLQQASFDQMTRTNKVMAAFREDFRAFVEAQFGIGLPVENVQDAMDNMTGVFRNVDNAPSQLYEVLFGLREASGRLKDALTTFYGKYADVWESMDKVEEALGKIQETPTFSNAAQADAPMENSTKMDDQDVYKEFMNQMTQYAAGNHGKELSGGDMWQNAVSDQDKSVDFSLFLRFMGTVRSTRQQEEERKEKLFHAFADFLQWMAGQRNRQTGWR